MSEELERRLRICSEGEAAYIIGDTLTEAADTLKRYREALAYIGARQSWPSERLAQIARESLL